MPKSILKILMELAFKRFEDDFFYFCDYFWHWCWPDLHAVAVTCMKSFQVVIQECNRLYSIFFIENFSELKKVLQRVIQLIVKSVGVWLKKPNIIETKCQQTCKNAHKTSCETLWDLLISSINLLLLEIK